MAEDWRLETLRNMPYLKGVAFVRKPYKAYRSEWNHDHCAACGMTLAERLIEGEDIIHDGYATTATFERGPDYEWVCVPCFDDFKSMMGWAESKGA